MSVTCDESCAGMNSGVNFSKLKFWANWRDSYTPVPSSASSPISLLSKKARRRLARIELLVLSPHFPSLLYWALLLAAVRNRPAAVGASFTRGVQPAAEELQVWTEELPGRLGAFGLAGTYGAHTYMASALTLVLIGCCYRPCQQLLVLLVCSFSTTELVQVP